MTWFNENWLYRKAITIDPSLVDADLSDFPVLVQLADDDLADKAQSDGGDIAFAAADGTTQLDHEIESFDGDTGELIAHVKVPTVSSTERSEIYLYYGNPEATNQANATGVWDSEYGAVWHFNDATGDLSDSTGNGNSGSVPSDIDRVLDTAYGPAYGFSDEVIDVDNISPELNFTETFTITLVVEIEQTQRYPRFISRGGGNSELDLLQWSSHLAFRMNGGTDFTNFPDISGLPKWFVYSYTYDYQNDTFKLIDETGSVVDTRNGLVALNTGGNNFQLGAVSGRWEAKLSRIEISQTARSDAWAAAENRNKNNPSTFCTLGSVDLGPGLVERRVSRRGRNDAGIRSRKNTIKPLSRLNNTGEIQ